MKEEYNKVYDNLFADYAYESNLRRFRFFHYEEYDLIRAIRRSIDRIDKENQLRPDAKYFLLVNFHHLIVRPLLDTERYLPIGIDPLSLENDIDQDIATIIRSSISNNNNIENNGKISGHQIMSTIDKLWRDLRTTKLDIWG